MTVAFLGAGAALVTEPAARAWIDGFAGPTPPASVRTAWLAVSLVLAGALLARGIWLCVGRSPPTPREAAAWGAGAALLGMLAIADRVRLLESQALMLGFIALVWWCSESAERAAAPSGHPAGSGAGVLTVLAGLAVGAAAVLLRAVPGGAAVLPFVLLCAPLTLVSVVPRGAPWIVLQCAILSVGVAGVGRVVGSAVLAARASDASGVGRWVIAVAEALSAPAYLSGLSVLAPEAAACGIAAAAVWSVGRSARRGPAVGLGVLLILVSAGLMVRWAIGMGPGR